MEFKIVEVVNQVLGDDYTQLMTPEIHKVATVTI
jgi:hypothetical protein